MEGYNIMGYYGNQHPMLHSDLSLTWYIMPCARRVRGTTSARIAAPSTSSASLPRMAYQGSSMRSLSGKTIFKFLLLCSDVNHHIFQVRIPRRS